MPAPNTISPEKLSRLVGTPACPLVIQLDSAIGALVPGAVRRVATEVAQWGGALAGRSAVVVCAEGGSNAAGVAAWLRHAGADAEVLEGGLAGWRAAGLPLINEELLPPRDGEGRTRWVTRARPKVDRIACPWLIRRFVDPDAAFLFVTPSEVAAVAERFGGTPFDIDDVYWSHRGELCTFDVMIAEFGLASDALQRLATIVRGADTSRHDLAPEAAGLLAASLGLSRMYADDLEQLEAGMTLYDAFYRWARDASEETHNWPSGKARS
jgi:hypothetical protein